MGEPEAFERRIEELLDDHQATIERGFQETEKRMAVWKERIERFEALVGRVQSEVLDPRLKEIAERFQQGHLTDADGVADYHSVLELEHTRRFPATARLEFYAVPIEDYQAVELHCRIRIIPVLMEFPQHAFQRFALEPESFRPMVHWVEDRILEFLKHYLAIETHPMYQRDNLVLDPICGMTVNRLLTRNVLSLAGQNYYFCSPECLQIFKDREVRTKD